MSISDFDKRAAALLHHFGQDLRPGDSVVPAISATAVYHLPGDPGNAPHQYGRYTNPTWDALEEALGFLEGAGVAIFPSGMAAITAALLSVVKSGDRILLPSDGYYNTRVLVEKFLVPLGIQVDTRPTVRMCDGGFSGYRVVLVETPSNPGLEVCDIAEVARGVKAAGGTLIADNTTMTPLGQQPLDLGAHLSVAAGTKAINGHSDVLIGHVASRDAELMTRVKEWRRLSGSIAGPFEAFLCYRGLETLEVRFGRMCASAAVIAERLASHKAVKSVRYPGLPHDPSHAIARRQMRGFGLMISLTLASGAAAEQFITGCKLIQPSTSFGGVRTSAERRKRWGDDVAEGFVRMSVGLEPVEALWAEMETTLR